MSVAQTWQGKYQGYIPLKVLGCRYPRSFSARVCVYLLMKMRSRWCSYLWSFITSISVELSRCRPSVASTAQETPVGRAAGAAIRAVSPFNYVREGFDGNSWLECKTLSVIH